MMRLLGSPPGTVVVVSVFDLESRIERLGSPAASPTRPPDSRTRGPTCRPPSRRTHHRNEKEFGRYLVLPAGPLSSNPRSFFDLGGPLPPGRAGLAGESAPGAGGGAVAGKVQSPTVPPNWRTIVDQSPVPDPNRLPLAEPRPRLRTRSALKACDPRATRPIR